MALALAIAGIAVVLLLTVGTALFVAAEFALVAADRAELEAADRGGDWAAGRALAAVKTLSLQLSGSQLGITITTLAVGFLAEPSITRLLRPVLESARLPDAAVETVGVVLALVIATVLQMVLGELVPKNWAIAQPTAVSRRIAGPMQAFTAALRPVIAASNALANAIVRAIGVQPQEELRSARSAAELSSLVRTSAEQGTLPGDTAALVARSLTFGAHTAGEVMTPRTQVVSVPADASVAVLLDLSRQSGHSRFPVTAAGGDLDDIVSIVHVKRAFTVTAVERLTTPVSAIAGPVPRVPQSLRLEPLLAQLRRPGLQSAAVIDEYGGTAGIVTLEDLVEELVGEVQDEHDVVIPPHRQGDRSSIEVPGRLRIDETPDVIEGFSPPTGPYDTLAGLFVRQLGRLAEVGDSVEVNGWTMTATVVDGHRIDTITVRAR